MRTKPGSVGYLLGMIVIAASGLGVVACGDSSRGPVPRDPTSAAGGASTAIESNFSTHKNDRDNDGDHNDDDAGVLYYGHAADAADHRISVALVRSYFAAAVAENGAKACSLLVPFIAESVAENNGHTPALRGKTCAIVVSKLFKLNHRQLQKKATFKVIGVRVEGDKALVVLDFPAIPEVRQIAERRRGSTWKLLELLDGILE